MSDLDTYVQQYNTISNVNLWIASFSMIAQLSQIKKQNVLVIVVSHASVNRATNTNIDMLSRNTDYPAKLSSSCIINGNSINRHINPAAVHDDNVIVEVNKAYFEYRLMATSDFITRLNCYNVNRINNLRRRIDIKVIDSSLPLTALLSTCVHQQKQVSSQVGDHSMTVCRQIETRQRTKKSQLNPSRYQLMPNDMTTFAMSNVSKNRRHHIRCL